MVVLTLTLAPHPARGAGGFVQDATTQASFESESRPTLGISDFVCHCSVKIAKEPGVPDSWMFDSEPEVQGIALGGPADGKLEAGDHIIAIDGKLITTAEGGSRWSSVHIGQKVTLRVSRQGAIRDVPITVGEMTRDQPEAASRSAVPKTRSTSGNLMPAGWLGIGLTCRCMVQSGEPPVWSFRESPGVASVAPAGPADRAGLKIGDVLLTINGRDFATEAGGNAFSSIEPGQRIALRVDRAGSLLEMSVEVVSPPGL